MARRWVREQVSQYHWVTPRSVPVLQVSGGGSDSAVAPHSAQLFMEVTLDPRT